MSLLGPDVSSYHGRPDWRRVRDSGCLFAGCKATEGLTYTDPTFGRNWEAMHAAGLVRIAYHFAHADPGRSPVAEAEHFLDCVRDHGGGAGGIPAFDLETGGLSGRALADWARTWCDHVASRWRAGLVYSGRWFWNARGLDQAAIAPAWRQ